MDRENQKENQKTRSSSRIELWDRDYELLKTLCSYRLLSTSQIAKLHFPSLKTAQRRIGQLTNAGLIETREQLVKRGENKERLHYLSSAGIMVLGLSSEEQKKARANRVKAIKMSDFFLDHFLAVNSFRISLALACQEKGFTFDWYYENETKMKDVSGRLKGERVKDPETGYQIIVVPDAYFVLDNPVRKANYFLEVETNDYASEFYKKATGYARYRLEGHYQRHWKDERFAVLTIVDEKYILKYLDYCGKIKNKELLGMFLFTDMEWIEKYGLFSEIWIDGEKQKRGLLPREVEMKTMSQVKLEVAKDNAVRVKAKDNVIRPAENRPHQK